MWEVVVRWAQYGAEASRSGNCGDAGVRRQSAEVEKALPLIRFPLMSEADLEVVSAHPLASSCRLLRDLLAEARASHADAARAEQLQVRRIARPRWLECIMQPLRSWLSAKYCCFLYAESGASCLTALTVAAASGAPPWRCGARLPG